MEDGKKSPRIFFRKRLKELRDYMEEMGKYTLEAYKDSIDVLFNYDEEKIATIMDINEKVDRMNYLLEQKTMSIIASEQPVARDLRFIEASIKVGSHFKRMTGLASNIAEVSNHIKDEKIPETPKKDIEHMADLVGSMVSKSITSFLNQDVETVRELHHDDDEVDKGGVDAVQHLVHAGVYAAGSLRNSSFLFPPWGWRTRVCKSSQPPCTVSRSRARLP